SLYKFRKGANDAGRIVWIVDMLFYEGREIKRHCWDLKAERCFACLQSVFANICNNICVTFSVG
ncbi:MAG: hypothetical protein K2F98_00900, partial [Bacteroides sp.]|nr:hypothetical protein [Bacteroides sp.]